MKNNTDLTNRRFGRLIAIQQVENDKHNHQQWKCLCDCGRTKVVLKNSLTSGRTRSCGCLYKETRTTASATHGQSKTRLFAIWASMIERCVNANGHDWKYYGGRGIKVCDEWQTFEPFSRWASDNGYSDNLTIDRIDVNGDYEPSNCRWADWQTQMNNTTRNHFIAANGEKHTLAEWSRITGISMSTILYRVKAGWKPEDIINTGKHIIRSYR